MMTLSRLTTSNKAAIMILSNKNDIPVRNAVMDYNYWLGRTIRVSLQDGRIFQGQFVAVDRRRNVLLRYCEALECSKASLRKN
jgi:small nuclear ribonucleoprotein (snRNP)-like protein